MTHRGPFQPLLFCDSVIGQSCARRTHCLAAWVPRRGLCLRHGAERGRGDRFTSLAGEGDLSHARRHRSAVQSCLDARFAASAVPSPAAEPARPARREPTQHIFALCLLAVACKKKKKKKKKKNPKNHFNNCIPCTQRSGQSRREPCAIVRWLERDVAGTGGFQTRIRGLGNAASAALLDEADAAMSWRQQGWGGSGHGTVLATMGRGLPWVW